MGITKLWDFIKKHSAHVLTQVQRAYFKDKSIGVDANLYLSKAFYMMSPLEMEDDQIVKTKLVQFVTQVEYKWRDLNMKRPAEWLFDGKPLANKTNTIVERQAQRQRQADLALVHKHQADEVKQAISEAVDLSEDQMDNLRMDQALAQHEADKHEKHSRKVSREVLKDVQEELKKRGVICVQCELEADFELAARAKSGYYDILCTGDGDAMASCVPEVCRVLPFLKASEETCDIYRPAKLLEHLQWTTHMWVDFCLLLGKDQDNMRLSGLGPVFAKTLIDEFKSIEGVLAARAAITVAGNDAMPESAKKRKRPAAQGGATANALLKITDVPEGYTEYLDMSRRLLLDPPCSLQAGGLTSSSLCPVSATE